MNLPKFEEVQKLPRGCQGCHCRKKGWCTKGEWFKPK